MNPKLAEAASSKGRQAEEKKTEKEEEDAVKSIANVKEDFASNVLSQNPELMRSMSEMFET